MSAKPDAVAEEMLRVEIDGKVYRVPKGAMIIEVADANGISIPRFCYHKKLPVAANCRMCMVEVEKAPKPLPACATPVMEGMKIHTRSEYAKAAQRAVMEFLLINHPLDCPICDQGGECELQDVALEYGRGVSRFSEKKRVVRDKDFGPLIASDMTRCIHCTRCVRFLQHVAGYKEMGGMGRGESVEIGTFVQHNIESELSGNIIDVCPVGALTSRPFRFRARAWEMLQSPSIAPHDCVGSNLQLHTRRGDLLRVVPRENEALNEVWLSDRDRFSYEGVNSTERLAQPMLRRGEAWHAVEWEEALHVVAQALRERVEHHGPQQLGILVSPSATLEEHSLAARLAEGLGVANIDHRLRQSDFSGQQDQPLFPWLGQSIEELERLDAALIVGGNPRKDQPIVGLRLRKAAQAGAQLMFINSVDYPVTFDVAHKSIVTPARMVQALAGVAAALLQSKKARAPHALRGIVDQTLPDATERAMAEALATGQRSAVLLGLGAGMHPAFSALRALAVVICELSGARLGVLSDGANSAGAWLAGVLPHRGAAGKPRAKAGLDAAQMLERQLKNYLLVGVEPELDCANGARALAAMHKAELVVALTPFVSSRMREYADVLLPVNCFAETSGTYVNCEGRWQSFAAASRAPGASRPAWKVLRVLGNLLELDGFSQNASEDVRDALLAQLGDLAADNTRAGEVADYSYAGSGLQRIGDLPMYRVDGLVRRAPALQNTADARIDCVRLNPADASRLGLGEGDAATVHQGAQRIELPVMLDERVAEGAALIAQAGEQTFALGAPYDALQLKKA